MESLLPNTILDVLPENFVEATYHDFYSVLTKNDFDSSEERQYFKDDTVYKEGLQFLLLNNDGKYEVYQTNDLWNKSRFYVFGKMMDLAKFIETKRCFINIEDKYIKPKRPPTKQQIKRQIIGKTIDF